MIFAIIAQASTATVDSLAKAKISQNAQRFNEIDPWGVGMTFIGMAVVFLSLLLLYILFLNITKILNLKLKRNLERAGKKEKEVIKVLETSGDINAAIAVALHLYMSEMHDHECTVLTINRVTKTYSPWSSKIYGLRQYPR
ncbi:MAG: OadG family protein [Ignavibacteriales bacterium]|nr:OadG family protein [Ignavibacteriales bacterium]